jgi:cell division septal protein FtsQ
MKRTGVSSFFWPLLGTVVILLAISLILGYIWKKLFSLDYFKIKQIIGTKDCPVDLSYLVGRNILSLDLAREASNIQGYCPDCALVIVARILPNNLYVGLISRRPVALVKLYRSFAVDASGVLFNLSSRVDMPELPVISGLETKIFGPKPGLRYTNDELKAALEIIRIFKRERTLRFFSIQKIDVTNLNSISIFIPVLPAQSDYTRPVSTVKGPFGFEVKISRNNLSGRIAILSGLVGQEKDNLGNIKYFDLRFSEPAIKYKGTDVKEKLPLRR